MMCWFDREEREEQIAFDLQKERRLRFARVRPTRLSGGSLGWYKCGDGV